ncbi:phage protein, partial [Staphylococcus aureus]
MIKIENKDRKTGKTESYTKEDVTMGEAEKRYENIELVNQENKKEAPNATKIRQKERQLLVDSFK